MKAKLISVLGVAAILATTLPVLAQTTSTGSGHGDATSTPPRFDAVCMQTAVDKRDSAIISAWDVYSAAVKSALSARKDALKSAWGITDAKERRAAIKKAWADFSSAVRQARKDFNSARKSAWKTFMADRRACGTGAVREDNSSERNDAAL